jgi:acyl-CoA thioester hydrolase
LRPAAAARRGDNPALMTVSTASPTAAAFAHRVRIYWEDTDAGGVVFYANYLKFFERARTEWLRSLGFEQQRMKQESGSVFIVTRTALRYRRPARLDDLLEVDVRVHERRQATLTLAQRAFCKSALLAEGEITIACVEAETFRPRRIPVDLLTALDAPAP